MFATAFAILARFVLALTEHLTHAAQRHFVHSRRVEQLVAQALGPRPDPDAVAELVHYCPPKKVLDALTRTHNERLEDGVHITTHHRLQELRSRVMEVGINTGAIKLTPPGRE